jgi:hypothetical protein
MRPAIAASLFAVLLAQSALPLDHPALEAQANREIESSDRKELVRPAPKGFKRGAKARQVALKLIPRETSLHVGQSFWYRLELQNTGQAPLEIEESPSFLKDGANYSAQKWEFHVTGPDGKRKEMILGTLADELLGSMRETSQPQNLASSTMSAQEREEQEVHLAFRRKAASRLRITLLPGEILVSRPWRWLTQLQYATRKSRGESIIWPKPGEPFRELWTVYRFKTPGRYTIEAEYVDEPPPPPSEEHLRRMEKLGVARDRLERMNREDRAAALGRIRSNRVALEVLP